MGGTTGTGLNHHRGPFNHDGPIYPDEERNLEMERVNAARILDWMDKHIDGCEDPRVTGKGLTANRSGQWRYRIGDYRVLCLLRDEVVTVEVFRIRHRSEAYK